ncbi:MAG: hypothetical protein JNK82_02895 [Myxococcaceae bacterium]|nr:hypothetical protein [Myxococcaceae bacterium]
MKMRLIALTAALASTAAFGESYKVNFHLSPMFGMQFKPEGLISGAEFKADIAALSIGPVSPQLEAFGLGAGGATLLEKGSLFGGGIGLRWRILNDEKGYRFMAGGAPHGNLHGNLYLDADFLISNGGTNGGPRIGFDAALGYEVSLIDGLQVGPFAKVMYLRDPMMLFGISLSIGAPAKVPDDFDPDEDGVKGDDDKCPGDAEDKDGFEDEDGCPDTADNKPKDGAPPAAAPPAAQ